jgi:predicted CXXCH cytochrome family protein
MKKLIIITFTTLLIAVVSSSEKAVGAEGGLGGDQSPHNFSHESWLPVTKICRVCHVPHRRLRGKKRPERYSNGLLWNRRISSFTYSLYNSFWSSSLTGIRDPSWTDFVTGRLGGMPDGLSKLCLSCHNGIVAPDVFNLHHFISLEYDMTKTDLRDPDITPFGVSGTISEVLFDGKIQCPSCHDAHDEATVPDTKLLRVKKTEICRACHRR